MLGIPSNSQATIQPTSNLRNHFFAAYGQDSWRLQNLTLNLGLRFEWENGISEDNGELIVDFDPNAKLAISDLAEAAYARAPIPQLAPADFRVRGGSVYATDPGQDGKVWRPQTMLMPRVSAAYKLGEKTVLKGGYGLYYDTLNAADYGQNNLGLQRDDDQHQQHGLRPDVPARQSVRGTARDLRSVPGAGRRHPLRRADRIDARRRHDRRLVDYTIQNQNHEHARQQRWRIGVQRELARNLSVEVAYDGSYADRVEIGIRSDYLPQQYLDSGQPERPRHGRAGVLTANVTNPYTLANFAALRTTNPVLYQRMAANGFFTATTVQRNRLLRPFSHINNLTYDNLPLARSRCTRCRST